ncbi:MULTISPECIES: DUF3817 domain-containing protein [Tsukamurella]|uniref:DUF3817 domain-containing protein n=1 Tax=Tsukamurella strandjordii TaxID=147577 RepID=A0AA90NHH8_9ACTN|nr:MULTISPECIES: DUF3817 domain-containing protein [Tsukamurella]MDP0398565.1 DUF3817 domain-containing protein [Tsukamurella strandjordii]GIZ99641.1 hypothetical protein TTY48_42530 [Tsukamurella sp. TY48]
MNESTASKIVTAFKVVAFAEALTWVWLLIGMYGKWVGGNEEAVAKPGMTHGIVFMVLVALTLAVAYVRKWDIKTLALGLLATVLPFCSVVFEVWAQKAGKLDAPAAAPASADAIGG